MVTRLYYCPNNCNKPNFRISFQTLKDIRNGKLKIVKCPNCGFEQPPHKETDKYDYNSHRLENCIKCGLKKGIHLWHGEYLCQECYDLSLKSCNRR